MNEEEFLNNPKLQKDESQKNFFEGIQTSRFEILVSKLLDVRKKSYRQLITSASILFGNFFYYLRKILILLKGSKNSRFYI